MSLFIIGSVSRVTSNIIHHLSKHGPYSTITIADLLPCYSFHHRYYRLQRELEQSSSKLNLNLTKISSINDLKKSQNFDNVLYVTHDYYQNVVSKTRLMELTALACKNRKNIYFATPAQYDHFGYANPETKYLEAEKKVFEINPNSTVIRSDVQDNTEALVSLKGSNNSAFKPNLVSGAEFATIVCNTMAANVQGKRILVRGSNLVSADKIFTYKSAVESSEYKHAKQNITFLASKYGTYNFQGYQNIGALNKVQEKSG